MAGFYDSTFRPFRFENGTDTPPFEPDAFPLLVGLGWRGSVLTLEGDLGAATPADRGLAADLAFLESIEWGECAYGAATCEMHPFLCEVRTERRPLTGADVLEALRTKHFRSRHIRDLRASSIPFPGYHPRLDDAVDNDEIHDEFAHQHLFKHELDEGDDEYHDVGDDADLALDPDEGTHGELRAHVAGAKLWYVLLHCTPREVYGYLGTPYVLLFAVGLSPSGDRLVGVVTHQVCHNLCD